MVHDGATLRLKTQRINILIGGRKKEDWTITHQCETAKRRGAERLRIRKPQQ
jgi:hypothetical protein